MQGPLRDWPIDLLFILPPLLLLWWGIHGSCFILLFSFPLELGLCIDDLSDELRLFIVNQLHEAPIPLVFARFLLHLFRLFLVSEILLRLVQLLISVVVFDVLLANAWHVPELVGLQRGLDFFDGGVLAISLIVGLAEAALHI